MKRKVHIVTYTHWDREFRWEFERTRMRLVDCIDHLLKIMEEKPEYRSFLMDGQMTLIEDYLEIRPENRQKITELVRAGRMEIGPWYTLADCAPIQGESVIRNLKYGIDQSRKYGEPMLCGYNVFSFGQIGQLPQIYAGFGIDKIIFYKYMDPQKSKYHEFLWESPDGTRALASRLGREARWNFFFAGHIPIVYDKDAWHKDWQYRWGELGKVFHTADADGHGWFYDILDPDTGFHRENIRKGMERALQTVEGTSLPESVLMFEGTDFTEPHPLTTEIIKAVQEEYGDELDVVHSTLSDYLNELGEGLKNRADLDVVKGPLRDGPVGAIHTDVFTTHPEIMIANSAAETKLLRYAEPMSAVAWFFGISDYPETYLKKAWKLMFESHAHDSMHGLGPAELSEGEISRLSQARIIAEGLERRGLQNITKEINTSEETDTEYFLAVHNPSPFSRSEVVEAYVDVACEHRISRVIIEDENHRPVLAQEMERKEGRAGIYHPRSRNMPFYSTKIHLYFYAEDIPAMGYRTFRLKWEERKDYPYPHEDWDTPLIYADNLATGPLSAENEYISVSINRDGTVNVLDKASGNSFENLNSLLDSGDIGNIWMSDQPKKDKIISSLGIPAHVSMTVNGPLVAKFEAEYDLMLPEGYDWTKQERSRNLRALPVKMEYTLKKGCQHLDVSTSIDNTVRDHYLKVCFPTGLNAVRTNAEGSFMVTEFAPHPGRLGDLRGNELARHPAQLWFNVEDENHNGFAVLTGATKDYELDERQNPTAILMGLVRGTRLRIACDNRLWMEYPGDESSQSLRGFNYRYAFLPHMGAWDKTGVYREALAFNTPMHICQFGKQTGRFKTSGSFLEIPDSRLVLSAVKKADDRDSIIIRIYNPTNDDFDASLTFGVPAKSAYLLELDEQRASKLEINSNRVSFHAGHGKIITLELGLR